MADQPKHLELLLWSMWDAGEKRHAQVVMNELGIEYEDCIAQSISDVWWFFGCTNIPDDLPPYIEPLNMPPERVAHWTRDDKWLRS